VVYHAVLAFENIAICLLPSFRGIKA